MRNRRSNSGCSSCGSGGTTRARSPGAGTVRARQTTCGTITVVDESPEPTPDPTPEPTPEPPDDGGGGEGGLSREALIGGAAVAGLGVAYLSTRN